MSDLIDLLLQMFFSSYFAMLYMLILNCTNFTRYRTYICNAIESFVLVIRAGRLRPFHL